MATKHINLKKVEKIAILTFKNALRLHEDSICLFKNKSYPSSYAISVFSLEEHGKVLWLEHFLFHSRCDGRSKPEDEEKQLNAQEKISEEIQELAIPKLLDSQ